MRIYKRKKYLDRIRPFYDSDIIKVITGIRRCGKSCILRLIIDELKAKGIDEQHIIYIPLDKRGFISIDTPERLDDEISKRVIDDSFYYLLIDEIQNVKGFERIIQSFQAEENFSIFLTGSNSYLLSDEISTRLTGRYISFEIFTLDFKEYIEMKHFLGQEIQSDIDMEFLNYIQEGGFPKALEFTDKGAKQLYTKSTIEEIFAKDIRTRNKIRNKQVFEALQAYVINNYGATFSTNSIYSYFQKVEKIPIAKITIRNYLDMLLKAKIIYKCERFDQKSKKTLGGECKYYLADMGIYFALNINNTINYGSSLENLVFLYLISNSYRIGIGRIGKSECDFITRDINNSYAYIQVAQTIANEKTAEREYRPFYLIKDGYPKYLLTLDKFRNQENGFKHLNAIDVFLKNEKL